MATVGANAVFAAVTGSSIASASVFTKVSVPQMMAQAYNPRFAVGVVAGSSVLGMIIPPSAMLIIYSFVAEQSVGDMFLAGVIPGIMLAIAYVGAIWLMGRFTPAFVGGRVVEDTEWMSGREIASKTLPTLFIITVVLGGIYTGWLTAVEAGAAGALVALIIAVVRKSMTPRAFWDALLETGHITAAILFLITAASIYSRMLGLAGLPQSIAGPACRELGVLLVDHVALRIVDAFSRNFAGHCIDHPDRRPVVPAHGRSLGHVADLVWDHHRGRRRNRTFDPAFGHILLRHQIHDQR